MFYNGSVAIFHLPQDKAEHLMKMAAGREDGGDGGRRQGGAVAANDHGDELVAKMKEDAHCKQEIIAAILPEAQGEVVQALTSGRLINGAVRLYEDNEGFSSIQTSLMQTTTS
ncbi:hypothetical protein ACP70R_038912 [Stipagrostis hirtigluma subsp. patula]